MIYEALHPKYETFTAEQFEAKLAEVMQGDHEPAPHRPRRAEQSTEIYKYSGIVFFAEKSHIPSIKMGICVICPKLPRFGTTFMERLLEDEQEIDPGFGPLLANQVKDALEKAGYHTDDELFPDIGWHSQGCAHNWSYYKWPGSVELPDVKTNISNLKTYWIQFTAPSKATQLSPDEQIAIEKIVADSANAYFARSNVQHIKLKAGPSPLQ